MFFQHPLHTEFWYQGSSTYLPSIPGGNLGINLNVSMCHVPLLRYVISLFLNKLTPSSCRAHIIMEPYKWLMISKVECNLKSMIVRERRKVLVSISQRGYGMDCIPHFVYDEFCDLGQFFSLSMFILWKMRIVTSDRVVVRLNLDNII